MATQGAKLEAVGGDRFRVTGQLDATSVVGVLRDSRGQFGESKEIDVDLGGVTESDSSGLALLLEWLRVSRVAERVIRFHNLPPQISALARISEVEDLFASFGETAAGETAPPAIAAAS